MVPIADVNTLLNNVDEALVIVDTEGTVLFFNKAAAKVQSLVDPPLRVGGILFDSIPEAPVDLRETFITNLISSRKPATFDTTFAHPEKTIHFEIKCTPITDQEDQVSQILIEARDVSPQKIFEKKITTIASELSGLIENANAVIIGIDTLGYIMDWNEMTTVITGYSKSEAFAQQFSDLLLDNENRDCFAQAMQNVFEGKLLSNYELPVRSKDKRKLTFLINATPRKNAAGQVTSILLVGHDHTELSEYRETLEQKINERTEALRAALQKEKELVEIKNRFVAIASHEFRSPLSSIQLTTESLKANISKLRTEDTLVKLNKIQSQVKHMSVLLEDVLTVGKSDSGKLVPNLDSVDLGRFLERIIDDVQNNTNNTHRIELNFPVSPLEIESDEKLLRNIFINLLNNAIKFSPGGKVVFLTVVTHGMKVEITITDRGIGIDEKDIERVFEPFNRGTNASQIKGTGLGLSIVKKAVETLGGKLQVKSKLGEGTEFTIQFDVTRP